MADAAEAMAGSRVRVVAFALAGALILGGCTSSVSGGGQGSGAPVTSRAPSTDVALSQQQAQDALLQVADVGSGFEQQASTDDTDPLPCEPDKPPLDQQFSPTAKALTDFALTTKKAELSEEIVVYADAATATRALSAAERGLSCHQATVGSGANALPVTLNGPTDLKSQLGVDVRVDVCEGWSVHAAKASVVLIVARIGPQLVVLTFTVATTVDTSTLPSTQALTNKAIQNVDAAL